jgi:uncharacterized membrane protein YccC
MLLEETSKRVARQPIPDVARSRESELRLMRTRDQVRTSIAVLIAFVAKSSLECWTHGRGITLVCLIACVVAETGGQRSAATDRRCE